MINPTRLHRKGVFIYHLWKGVRVYEAHPDLIGPLQSIAMLLSNVVVPTRSGAAYKAALVRDADGYFEWICPDLHRTILEADKCSRDKWFAHHG